MALFLGFCTENLPFALALGLVLELFWIDALRLGCIVPPSGTFSFLLLYPLCILFQWYLPSMLPIPLVICLGFGYAASWLEQWHRRKNMAYDACLQEWVEKPHIDESANLKKDLVSSCNEQEKDAVAAMAPTEIIAFARWQMLWSAALLYMVCFSSIYAFFHWLQKIYTVPSLPMVSWNVLYGVGLLGAVLSLRTKRAYAVLGVAFFFLFLWFCIK